MTFNETKNLYSYLLKFFNKTQIIEFCCVTQSEFCYFMKSGKGTGKNKDKINCRMQMLKNKIMLNAKNGGF